ncbi:MAG: trigger factor [Deltaproteobacteria bacterium RBG_13_61_14]|nr:MAG: trigger factor [Deltaproteobacteria bacterium RBG_13_61_14]
MQVEVEEISAVEKKLTVTIPVERVQDEVEEFYAELSKNVRLKGFRPGKAPRPHLERLFGEEVKTQVGAKLIKDTFQTALERKQLKPASEPAAEPGVLDPNRDFTYTLRVEVVPPVELHEYKGLEVEKEMVEVTEPSVDEALERMRQAQATFKDLDPGRGAEPGDLVVIDLAAKREGKPLGKDRGKSLRLILGEGDTIPQLHENLKGLKPGESRTFEVTYAADDPRPELAGKTIEYAVTLKELKERILPALDDEFAKDQGNCASLAELREKTRQGLATYYTERSRRRLEQAVVDRLVEKNPIAVPPSLVHRRAEELARSALMLVRQRQVSEEALHQLAEQFEDQAKKDVQAAYLIEAVAAREKLEVSEEDLANKIAQLAESQHVHPDKLKDRLAGEEDQKRLKAQVEEEKTLAFLLEQAKIKIKEVRSDAVAAVTEP